MKFKILETPPVTLGIFLLTLGCFYSVIKRLGYIFIPVPVPVIGDICSGTLIIWLTNKTIGCGNFMASDLAADEIWLTNAKIKKENTKNKLASAFLLLMPFITAFFIYSKGSASSINISYVIHSYFTFMCGLTLFVYRIRGKAEPITAKTLLLTTLIVVFIGMMFERCDKSVDGSGCPSNTELVSEMSPNGIYLGKIIEGDAGATGGSTIVYIIPQRYINLLFGLMKKETQMLHGRWGEYRTLRWETDEILHINGRKYLIDDGKLVRATAFFRR